MRNKTINECGNDFVEQRLEAEKCLLALGWMRPHELNDIGFQLQLCGSHFSTYEHSIIYTYACLTAQAGFKLDVLECIDLGAKHSIDLDGNYLFNLILQTDIADGMLRTYAEAVLDYARRRKRAEQCFDQWRYILTSRQLDWRTKNVRPKKIKRRVQYA